MKDTEITASLRYLVPGKARPVYIASRGGADAALKIGAEFEDHEFIISDARQLEQPADLDRQGLAFYPQDTQVKDFYALDDLVASERRAEERVGELELVSWNPAHRWYYYPVMQREEVLLIKTFDAARDGRARRSIHTAFDNPQTPSGAPARESMESRLLVFF